MYWVVKNKKTHRYLTNSNLVLWSEHRQNAKTFLSLQEARRGRINFCWLMGQFLRDYPKVKIFRVKGNLPH